MDIFLVLSDHSREWKSFVSLLALALYAQTQINLQVMIQKTIILKSSQPTRATRIDTSSLFIIQVQILSQKFIPLIGNLSQSKEDMRLQGKKWQVFIINYVFHLSKFLDVRIRCEIVFLLFWMFAVYYGSAFPLTENLAFNGGDLVVSE